ncbi:PEP-CTERM sorting domain-containing protein [Variovorax sp. YR752]|uniref:PEP-CTERM sorting domain-containing protein n=1 Tax=Variovorax sp. YR752 TaxID=1884383 RepID=UPI00313845BE
MNKHFRIAALAAALATAQGAAQATLITTAPGGASVIDFDDAASYVTGGPSVQTGGAIGADVQVSTLGGPLQFGAPYGAWTLSDNGEWTGASFVGVDGAFQDEANGIAASLVFDLAIPQGSVGGFLNFDPSFVYGGGLPLPLYIAAYDGSGTLLEDHFVPLWTPGGLNAGSFFGISLDSNAIARFEVSGPYAVLDNLTLAPVPEPGSVALLMAGLGVLGAVARRRREN